MKTLEITDASLEDYDPKAETWVLTRRGKPVAAVVPIRPGMDVETFALSHNPAFIEAVNRSWNGYQRKGGTSLAKIRTKYGIRRQTVRRRLRRGQSQPR